MTPRRMQGFSLIELMVALVAGLIVVGAVLVFTMSSLRSNTDYIQSTRLTQELRNTIDFISRELRRAGYDENAMNYYSQPAAGAILVSPFAVMNIVNPTDPTNPEPTDRDACVIYAYDRGTPVGAGAILLADGEIRGIRRRTTGDGIGVIEVAESAAGVTPACDGDSPDYTNYPAGCSAEGWCALTDHRVLNIASLAIDTSGSWGQDTAVGTGGTPIQVRDLRVSISGSLVGQPDVIKGTQTRVRVRADCLRTNAQCNFAPTGA